MKKTSVRMTERLKMIGRAGLRFYTAALLCVFLTGILAGCGEEKSGPADAADPSLWETIDEDEMVPEEGTFSAKTEETGASDDSGKGSTDSENAETDGGAQAGGENAAAYSYTPGENMPEVLLELAAQYRLNEENFSCAYMDLTTQETVFFNELKMWDACSTYKFPLNLMYYDMEAEGKISGSDIVPGTDTTLAECHRQSLELSNNELSEAMMDNLGEYISLKTRMRKYFTLSDEEIDPSYYTHNWFCARMMMDCSAYLYSHQEEYPDALKYLEAAQPDMYFKKYIKDVPIAQKYGRRDTYEHCAGIVFGDHPFVLAVYSEMAGGEDMIAKVAEAFYELSNHT